MLEILAGAARAGVLGFSVMLHDPLFGTAFSLALLLAATWLFSEQKRLPFLLSALFIALLLGLAFKPFLQQERPCAEVPGKIPCPPDFSLPSLHALLAFTLAIVSLGNRSFAIYFPYSLFVAYSRVYLGVHTVSQVASGLAMAFFACVLCELAWRAMRWEIPRAIHIKHDKGRIMG